jgi:putative spermidine/putrescine transport system substrate-binding protein
MKGGEILTRRELLLRGGAAAAGGAALGAFPRAAAVSSTTGGAFMGTLRVLGDGITQLDPIKQQAEKDLGFEIAFDVTDPDSAAEKAITQPGSFDVLAYYHFGYDAIWPRGSLAPVDTRKITRWNQVSDLFKRGKVRPGAAPTVRVTRPFAACTSTTRVATRSRRTSPPA